MSLGARKSCTYVLTERRWHPGWVQAKGPILWVPGEPRWDFMCPSVRKSLRTPEWRHRRQEKRKAIVVVEEEDGTPVLM
jgi:hypothetical protein